MKAAAEVRQPMVVAAAESRDTRQDRLLHDRTAGAASGGPQRTPILKQPLGQGCGFGRVGRVPRVRADGFGIEGEEHVRGREGVEPGGWVGEILPELPVVRLVQRRGETAPHGTDPQGAGKMVHGRRAEHRQPHVRLARGRGGREGVGGGKVQPRSGDRHGVAPCRLAVGVAGDRGDALADVAGRMGQPVESGGGGSQTELPEQEKAMGTARTAAAAMGRGQARGLDRLHVRSSERFDRTARRGKALGGRREDSP